MYDKKEPRKPIRIHIVIPLSTRNKEIKIKDERALYIICYLFLVF